MAQAILLKDHESLGERGDVIDVSPGYLRNFLVPRKLAQPATPAAIAETERRREAAERATAEAAAKAEETASLLKKTVLTISHQAGDDGRLFGSVTSQEIVDAIRQARGVRLDKRRGRSGAHQDHGHPHGHRRGRGRRDDGYQDHRHPSSLIVTLRGIACPLPDQAWTRCGDLAPPEAGSGLPPTTRRPRPPSSGPSYSPSRRSTGCSSRSVCGRMTSTGRGTS